MKDKYYDFSKGFAMFIIGKVVAERYIKGDDKKINKFLKDIFYKQRRDTKNNRSELIRKMLASISEPTSQVI